VRPSLRPHTDHSFGSRTGGHAGDQVAAPIGGYLRAGPDQRSLRAVTLIPSPEPRGSPITRYCRCPVSASAGNAERPVLLRRSHCAGTGRRAGAGGGASAWHHRSRSPRRCLRGCGRFDRVRRCNGPMRRKAVIVTAHPLERVGRGIVDLLVKQGVVQGTVHGTGDVGMGGQAVRGSGRLLVPVSALSSESGPEVHEAVVRADACDEVSRRLHVPPVRGCVHLVESFLVLEDVLPGAVDHMPRASWTAADAHAVSMRCPRMCRLNVHGRIMPGTTFCDIASLSATQWAHLRGHRGHASRFSRRPRTNAIGPVLALVCAALSCRCDVGQVLAPHQRTAGYSPAMITCAGCSTVNLWRSVAACPPSSESSQVSSPRSVCSVGFGLVSRSRTLMSPSVDTGMWS